MILLIDNYDSFSYNLYQLVGEINPDIKVIRNDEMTTDEIKKLNPEKIIISPGPGRPEKAGIITELVKTVSKQIPTLGVCLGHQAICLAYGAKITYAKQLMHGKQSLTTVDTDSVLFNGMDKKILTARYHSLCAENTDSLKITARADDGEIMAVEHKKYPIYGVQFHPESIMTPCGKQILKNFLGVKNDD